MKNVLFFGATSMIATHMARQISRQAQRIDLVGRDAQKLELLAADLRVRGCPLVRVKLADLTAPGHADAVARWAEDVDTVVLAQGVLGDQDAFEQDPTTVWSATAVNLTSYMEEALTMAQVLAKNGGGRLIILSSVAGERGKQSNLVYSAQLAGRTVFADGLRHRFAAKNVHVLTVKLGPTDTPMTAHMKKGALMAKPEVVAEGVWRAVRAKRRSVYVPKIWCWIMLIIRNVPEFILHKTKL